MSKFKQFFSRWWTWIFAALGIVAALSAGRRANIRVDKANRLIQDKAVKEIEAGWDEVDNDVNEFLSAQKRAKQANDKLNIELDRIAKSDDSAAVIISDWNADNRLRDREDVT